MPQPNILFLMTDQLQGQVLDEGHLCQTPNIDRLIRRRRCRETGDASLLNSQ